MQPGAELLIMVDKGQGNTMLNTAVSMQCITTEQVELLVTGNADLSSVYVCNYL